jgi:PilZ domain/SPOR domain
MVRTERRQAPRMTVKGLAYVNLDRDNGGIILNISEGGLCFQSTAPVQCTETIRFWFSYCSQRIEADVGKNEAQTRDIPGFIETGGELAWTDDAQKTGGLRFTNLPPEARKQIRDWIRQYSLVKVNEKSAPSSPSSHKSPLLTVKRADTNAAGSDSTGLEALFRHVQSGRLWTGFSGGLVAGLLVSAIVVTVFLLLSHSHELGDSLIQLGERLGGRSWSGSQEPHSTAPEPPAELQTLAAEPVQAPLPKKSVSTEILAAAKPSGVELEAANHGTLALSAPSVKVSGTPAVSSTAGRPLVPEPEIFFAPTSEPNASIFGATALDMELRRRPSVHIEPSKGGDIGMRSEKYLEVGKFKEKLLAERTNGQLSQLGFPANIIQRNRFLGKSYQVLVGPYGSDNDAEAVHKELASLGFTPRSYERGQRDFSLSAGLKVGGTDLPVGNCVISWESYTPNALVKFESDRGMSVTVEGKWVNQGARYSQNAIVYVKNRDGSRTLLEIRFNRMGRALVFRRG